MPQILRVTGKGGHVDFSAESSSAPPHGLRLCVSDLQLVNFMKDKDGSGPGIVAVDCGGYSFLPPSFFGMALGVGSLGHRIETMLPRGMVPRTNVPELVSASCALVPFGKNEIGEYVFPCARSFSLPFGASSPRARMLS